MRIGRIAQIRDMSSDCLGIRTSCRPSGPKMLIAKGQCTVAEYRQYLQGWRQIVAIAI